MRPTDLHSLTDTELIRLIGQNNTDAFNQLFSRYWRALYNKANAVLDNQAVAKDIVQEVFFDIWQRRNTINLQHVKAYLEQAVRFQVFKAIRANKASRRLHEKLHTVSRDIETEQPGIYKDYEELLNHLINQLPEDYREAFRLSRTEQLSYQEIALELSITERAVEYRIAKALEFFRANYKHLVVIGLISSVDPKIFF